MTRSKAVSSSQESEHVSLGKFSEKESAGFIIEELNLLIIESKEDFISVNWLRKNKKRIYNALFGSLGDEFVKMYLEVIRARLSSGAAKKLCFDVVEARREMNIIVKIKELNKKLGQRNPKRFNSRYIKDMDRALFNFLARNVRDSKGYIDWNFIVGGIDEELKPRFKYPVRYDRSLPKKEYEDKHEVEMAIGKNGAFLYTFFKASRGEEFDRRDEICVALIKLAKKGNKHAETELINLVSFLADRWADNLGGFKVYKYHQNERQEIIRRCIYNYKNGGPFVGYIHKSLLMAAMGLKHFKELNYDECVNL